MEVQIIRLTTKCDTIKSAFELLANAVQLPLSDPLQFNPAVIQQLLTPHSICPTPESHPLIHFWTQEDWNKWLMSPKAQMSTHGRYGFLEDEKGEPLSDSILKEICKIAHGGWVELMSHNLTLKSWGKIRTTRWQVFHNIMEISFPLFKFVVNGWKLDHLVGMTYPAWYKNHIEGDDPLKPWGKHIKLEDGEDTKDEDKKDKFIQQDKHPKNSIKADASKVKTVHTMTDIDAQPLKGELTSFLEPVLTTGFIKMPDTGKGALETPNTSFTLVGGTEANKENIPTCGGLKMCTNKAVADPLTSLRVAGFIAYDAIASTPTVSHTSNTQDSDLPGTKTDMVMPFASIPTNPTTTEAGLSHTSIPSPATMSIEIPTPPVTSTVAQPLNNLPALPPAPAPISNNPAPTPAPVGKFTKAPGTKPMHKCMLNLKGMTEEFQSYYGSLTLEQHKVESTLS
ncbi:hypothetical protein V8B97DRAFT_2069829 [Scleroderma yunnanense]